MSAIIKAKDWYDVYSAHDNLVENKNKKKIDDLGDVATVTSFWAGSLSKKFKSQYPLVEVLDISAKFFLVKFLLQN